MVVRLYEFEFDNHFQRNSASGAGQVKMRSKTRLV